jgi:hypothetical protein
MGNIGVVWAEGQGTSLSHYYSTTAVAPHAPCTLPCTMLTGNLKIMAVTMDNASNNDTMMAGLEDRFLAEGQAWSCTDFRIRCMPHTIHLAALKVRDYLSREPI